MIALRYICCAAALSLLLFAACQPGIESPTGETTPAQSDPVSALWADGLKDFRSWEIAPGTSEKMEGRGWHTQLATVRGNAAALQAIASAAPKMPDGAVMVKENFDGAGVLQNIVAIQKRGGEWLWVQYDPNGKPEISGADTARCLECHGMTPNDMVFTWKRPRSGQ